MRKCFRNLGALAALAIAGLLAAPAAQAQAPQLCRPGATDFTKNVTLVDVDSSGGPTPGDQMDFTVLLCNPPGSPTCGSQIRDDIDGMLLAAGLDPAHLNLIPLAPKIGCPTDGSIFCEKGPNGGPYTEISGPTLCGQDCTAPADQITFQPDFTVPTQLLQGGQCYRLRFRTQISSAITATECLCNQAVAVIDIMGNEASSNDPNWVTLAPGLGCADSETCPGGAGQCGTCRKIDADANLTTSTKCIDSQTPPCTTTVPKAAGSSIVYNFTLRNTGTAASPDMLFSDPLDFQSSSTPPTPCLDTAGLVTVSPLSCSWGPCAAPDYEIVWDAPNATVRSGSLVAPAPLKAIPTGGSITFSVTASIAAGANGNCTNVWNLQTGLPPVPIPGLNSPVFNVAGNPVVVEVTKTPQYEIVQPGTSFDWSINIRNTGSAAANNVTFTDTLPSCATLVSCPSSNPAIPLNCTPPGPVSPVTPFSLAASASQQVVVRTTAGPAPAPPIADCINPVQVSGGNFNAVTGNGRTCIGGISVTKVPSAAQVDPGAAFKWTITIRNNCATQTARGVNFSDVLPSCSTLVSCDATTPPITLNCTGGSVSAAAPFDIPPGGSVVIPINVTASTTAGTCENTVTTTATNASPLDPIRGSVAIRGTPAQIEVTKSATPNPVSTGGNFEWVVTLRNLTTTPITNVMFSDDISQVTSGCDTTVVACTSNTTPPLTFSGCNPGPPATVMAGPFNIPASGTVEIRIQLTGNAAGTCRNIARVTGSSVGQAESSEATEVIQTTGACALNNGDVTVLSPLTPAKTGAWLYTKTCAAVDPVLPNVLLPVATSGVDIEPLGSTPPLRLYQLDCNACTALGIYLSKRGTPAQVHLTLF